jgi:tripartite-type tricarboxylate transporter receptor subunit TctC
MRIAFFLLALAGSAASFGQSFPAKPITLVVPFAPGGPAEAIARIVVQPMEQILGEKVIVEAKPGAGGNIGAQYVAKQSRPDGYTLFFGSTSLASSVSLMKLNYDARKDLLPVAGIGILPNLVITGPNTPYKTLADVVKAAKAKPGTLTFGSSGPGTGSHLAGELFKAAAGIDLVHVPYKGSAAVIADLIAGRVDLLFELQSSAMGRVRAGQVRALATTASRRAESLPDVPTVAELGYPGFETGAWNGFFVPAGTPPEILAKLEDATIKALRTDYVKQKFAESSVLPIPESANAFAKYFHADIERWAKLVREGRLKPIE